MAKDKIEAVRAVAEREKNAFLPETRNAAKKILAVFVALDASRAECERLRMDAHYKYAMQLESVIDGKNAEIKRLRADNAALRKALKETTSEEVRTRVKLLLAGPADGSRLARARRRSAWTKC